jgi:multidrug efflux pump subunit AcrA (membrane-fusion protein)
MRIFDRLSDMHLSDTNALKNWGQRVVEQLEEALAQQQTTIDDLAAAVADIAAAQAAADAAQADADAAQTTANTASTTATTANTTATTVKRDDAISSSWTSPGAVLSASDAGATATIAIAAHTRNYDQTSRNGGSVSYQTTTDPNNALPNAAAGRHFVGKITTPADGGGSTSGGFTPPGGWGSENDIP